MKCYHDFGHYALCFTKRTSKRDNWFWVSWTNPTPNPKECFPNEFYIIPTIHFHKHTNGDFRIYFNWLGFEAQYYTYPIDNNNHATTEK